MYRIMYITSPDQRSRTSPLSGARPSRISQPSSRTALAHLPGTSRIGSPLPGRMPADARKPKEGAPEESTVSFLRRVPSVFRSWLNPGVSGASAGRCPLSGRPGVARRASGVAFSASPTAAARALNPWKPREGGPRPMTRTHLLREATVRGLSNAPGSPSGRQVRNWILQLLQETGASPHDLRSFWADPAGHLGPFRNLPPRVQEDLPSGFPFQGPDPGPWAPGVVGRRSGPLGLGAEGKGQNRSRRPAPSRRPAASAGCHEAGPKPPVQDPLLLGV